MIKAMKQALEAMMYADACLKKQLTTKTKHEHAQDLLMDAGTSLRQAIAEFDSHTLYREGYVNGYVFGEAAGKQAIAELESQEPVALQMDVIVVNLVREGINKHRARELAEHFIRHTHPPQRTEQNFCSRCGKRTPDLTHIHTCTPSQD